MKKSKFPPRKSISKFEKAMKPFITYTSKVVKGLSKAGLGDKHILKMDVIMNAYLMSLPVKQCIETYLKSLQLTLQFEKDQQSEKSPL
jgi:hypothetical protein